MATIKKYVGTELFDKYEFYNYNHALEILTEAYPTEWNDFATFLKSFSIRLSELEESGGNESIVPKKLKDNLYPRRWRSVRISGDLHIQFFEKVPDQRRYETDPYKEEVVSGFLDGRNIDFLKNRVALICEWNSKDSIFDRDLQAVRAFYDANIISAAILITRGRDFNEALEGKTYSTGEQVRKYGSSSTWIDKLIPRLDSRQNGGCPVLAVGITSKCFEG